MTDSSGTSMKRGSMKKQSRKDEKVRVAFRWDNRLIARIDEYADRVRADMPGLAFTRTEAVRVLLEKALAASEAPASSRRRRG